MLNTPSPELIESAALPANQREAPLSLSRPNALSGRLRNPVLWVAISGLALAALFARVPLSHLNEGAVGGDTDGYNNIWNYYWLKTALVDLHQNPYYTDYIYYPTGTSLRFHTFNPLNGLITMPFNMLIGYIPTFNLIFFFAPALTLLFSFLLIRDIVGNPWAAFAGAVVATYADYHVAVFLTTGQSSYITLQWIPLYFFFLFRAVRGRPVWNSNSELVRYDGSKWHLYVALSILALLCITLTDWQFLMLAVLATLLYGVFVLLTPLSRREKGTVIARLSIIGGIYAAIVALPLLFPMLQEAASSPWLDVSYQSVLHSVDLGWLLNPGIGVHGIVVLSVVILGAWAALRQRGEGRLLAIYWLVSIAFFYLMSLGPTLVVNGQSTSVPLLYTLLQKVPVLSSGRDPARFTLIATIGMGVFFAFGVRALLGWLQRSFRASLSMQRQAGFVPALVVTGLLIAPVLNVTAESGAARISSPDFPDFYRQLAQDKDTYAILELPLFSDEGRGADHYQMYQILHQKLRYSGRLARDRKLDNPNNFVKRASLLRYLWLLQFSPQQIEQSYPDKDFLLRTDLAADGVPILNYYNTRYIVLYKEAITSDVWARMETALHQVLGSDAAPVFEDKVMQVYQVPKAPPPANPVTLDVGDGWYSKEVGPGGKAFRWADTTVITAKSGYEIKPTAQLYSMNLSSQPVHALLKFDAFAYKTPRTLKIDINGNEALSMQVDPARGLNPASIELTLPPGNNLIELTSPQPSLPTDNPETDARLLSFGLQDVSLLPQP